MNYVEQLQSEHKARHARLFDPPPFKRKPLPKIIPIINGKQFIFKPAPKKIEIVDLSEREIATLREQLEAATRKAAIINGEHTFVTSINNIVRIVAQFYGVTANDVRSQCRSQKCVLPRHVAMYLAKKLTLKSYPEIARRIGDRDHTVALHACRKIESLRQSNADMDLSLVKLEQTIAAKYPGAA